MNRFLDKLNARLDEGVAPLCIGLDPNPARKPQRYPDLLSWNRAIIAATSDIAAAYKPNIAFYEALGREGYELLAATLAAIPPEIPIILDAKRGDIGSTAAAYARACFDVWDVDAVTLSPYLGADSIRPFTAYPERYAFVLSHTSNPGAAQVQGLTHFGLPIYQHIARMATGWGSGNVGLVVGATYPQALRQVRALAPDAWFLVPGVGAQGGDAATALAAGSRYDGRGVLINVSRGVALADDHRHAAMTYVNQLQAAAHSATTEPHSALTDFALALFDIGAIRFGDFTLASGKRSPLYIDLRLLVSHPSLLTRTARLYALLIADLPVDRLAGVPYAALPLGTAVSLETGLPLIYTRKEPKNHGRDRKIEGEFSRGERAILIEDLVTTAGSLIKSVGILREAGLIVEHAAVLIDREQGGSENLARMGVQCHAAFSITRLLDILRREHHISAQQNAIIRDYLLSD